MAARGLVVLCALALAGCSAVPQGAGLKRDVLARQKAAAGDDDAAYASQFAVEPVNRARVDLYAAWPSVGESGLGWLPRIDQPDTRILAPGDSIRVTIWNTEENGLLTAPGQRFVTLPDQRLSSSGAVFLPYVGTLKLSGMSPEHAREVIETRYATVSPQAQVQLEMVEGRQNTVSLVGGVGKPGVYPLPDRDFTVMSLIAEGGGVQGGLQNPQIRLQRGGTLYGTSVGTLLDSPGLDTTLRGGDKIFVKADERYFLSLGAAGKESVQPFPKERVTALDALSIVGGVSDSRADARGILVLRRYPAAAVRQDGGGPSNTRTVFTIDLTTADGLFSAGQFLIRSGDLVYVTESPVTRAQTIFGLIGASLGLARQVEATAN